MENPQKATEEATSEIEQTEQEETSQQQEGQENQENQEGQAHATTDWKKEAKKWEKRSKANLEELEKLKGEIQGATNSDKQRIQELEQQLSQYQAEKQKQELYSTVSKQTNVPTEIIAMLNGADEQAINAQALELAKYFKHYPTTKDSGAQKATPISKADILKVKDSKKRKQLIAENIELFN